MPYTQIFKKNYLYSYYVLSVYTVHIIVHGFGLVTNNRNKNQYTIALIICKTC